MDHGLLAEDIERRKVDKNRLDLRDLAIASRVEHLDEARLNALSERDGGNRRGAEVRRSKRTRPPGSRDRLEVFGAPTTQVGALAGVKDRVAANRGNVRVQQVPPDALGNAPKLGRAEEHGTDPTDSTDLL